MHGQWEKEAMKPMNNDITTEVSDSCCDVDAGWVWGRRVHEQ